MSYYASWQQMIARGAMNRVKAEIEAGNQFGAGVALGLIMSGHAGSVFTQDDAVAELKAEARRLIDAKAGR